ncbi:hypothetical protein [Micromonospora sp. L32]|uniref:hypothetical protein n=1 Tax=Micromonospora sp. L32 TaxID=3452214 RepID=UPI003F89BD56
MADPISIAIAGFLADQIRRRAEDSAWDFGRRLFRGDPYEKELSGSLTESLRRALQVAVGLDPGSPANDRAIDVLLHQADVRQASPTFDPGQPMLLQIGAIMIAQIALMRSDVEGLDATWGPTSPLDSLEEELGVTIDDETLARQWLSEFVADVEANRLRGGALAYLAVQFDAERNRTQVDKLADHLRLLGARISGWDNRLAALQGTAAAAPMQRMIGHVSSEDAVRALAATRARRVIDTHPLLPSQPVRVLLSDGSSVAEWITTGRGPLSVTGHAGTGKTVALAVATVELASAATVIPVWVHWWDIAVQLPSLPSSEDFERAVVNAVAPDSLELRDALLADVASGGVQLLIDGIDETDGTRESTGRRRVFLQCLVRWRHERVGNFVLAGRPGPLESPLDVTAISLARPDAEQIRSIVADRVGAADAPTVVKRIERGHLDDNLLLINLAAMAAASDTERTWSEATSWSSTSSLVPVITRTLCEGSWRDRGLQNPERVVDDLLDAAGVAAWNLGKGRSPGPFTHRQFVEALGGDRDLAYQLEDYSNLLIGGPRRLQFVHRLVADHLIALHAAQDLNLLKATLSARFWEHDTKYLLHDVSIISNERAALLGAVAIVADEQGPAFDRGAELTAAVANVDDFDLDDPKWGSLRNDTYAICAARPEFAVRHLATWKHYWADARQLLEACRIPAEAPLTGDRFDEHVTALLSRIGGSDHPEARVAAANELKLWLRVRRTGRVSGGVGVEDTFAPTGSVIMPTPESDKSEYLTLYKRESATYPWTERKPAIGWLLCRLRPTHCDLNGEDVCEGGWSNRYVKSIYKPFGLRCAWVSAMARDRDFVQQYLNADDLAAIVTADRFEWSRAHALAQLALVDAQRFASLLEDWWNADDTTADEQAWVVSEIQKRIEYESIGAALAAIGPFLRDPSFLSAAGFPPAHPSMLAGNWRSHWVAATSPT